MEKAGNYYKLLGLSDKDKNLTEENFIEKLKKNYKKLCIKYHPDKNMGKTEDEIKEAENKFKEVNEAYNILLDVNKRHIYDNFGEEGLKRGGNPNQHSYGFNDYVRVSKGEDIEVLVELTLEDIFNGINNKIIEYINKVPCAICDGKGYGEDGHYESCKYCDGTGHIVNHQEWGNRVFVSTATCPYCNGEGVKIVNPCKTCNGSGLINKKEKITINIPCGVDNNSWIRIPGMGNSPRPIKDVNSINGDLYIKIKVLPHKDFNRDGLNLEKTINISIFDALLGKEFEVTTIEGKVLKTKVVPLTKNNTLLKIQKHGMKDNRGYRGDLILNIIYAYPNELTSEQIELLTKIKQIEDESKSI